MEEWVTKAHDLLIKYGFRKNLLAPAVKKSNLTLRDGVMRVFDLLENKQVRGGAVRHASGCC